MFTDLHKEFLLLLYYETFKMYQFQKNSYQILVSSESLDKWSLAHKTPTTN